MSIQEHIDRLVASRLQADILGVETIIVGRTDAEAATLLGMYWSDSTPSRPCSA